MNVGERIQRVYDFCFDPYIKPKTLFEEYWLYGTRNFNGRSWAFDYLDTGVLPATEKKMTVRDYARSRNLVLYSGGKDSFMTTQFLKFFGVPFEVVLVNEKGAFHVDEQMVMDELKVDKDHIIESDLMDRCGLPQFGKHMPLLYFYAMKAMERFPGSTLWCGCEWESDIWCMQNFNSDQSDILFYDVNSDSDVNGGMFSCLNSLREFDIFRLAVEKFGFDIKWSCYDNPGKRERLEIYQDYANVLKRIEGASERSYILHELDYVIPAIRIKKPLIYDFRDDVVEFLRQFPEFRKNL